MFVLLGGYLISCMMKLGEESRDRMDRILHQNRAGLGDYWRIEYR